MTEEDFSASATLIQFEQPIPLLRGPLPASSSDDPSLGPFVLSFPDDVSWRRSYRESESKIIEQGMAGARASCAIIATKKCKPPWWKSLSGSKVDLADRERCEEEETAKCIEAAKEQCVIFAKEKCLSVYRDARIALSSFKHVGTDESSTVEDDGMSKAGSNEGVTNIRGSALLLASASDKKGMQ